MKILKKINFFKSVNLKEFLYMFLPLLIVLNIATFYIYRVQKDSKVKMLAFYEKGCIDLVKKSVENMFINVCLDLKLLSEMESFKSYISSQSRLNIKRLKKDFVNLSNLKKNYHQIRFIDISGMERIRVNFDEKSSIVEDNKLQDKSKRYYFRNAINLEEGEYYASPFDLNVENNKIETPHRPMIRIGLPVFNKAEDKVGVLIINFDGTNLIKNIKDINKDLYGNFFLLNSDGYFLSAHNPELEWGFMFDDKKELKVDKVFKGDGKKILESEKGQIFSENGIFSYETIYPVYKCSLATGKIINGKSAIVREPYSWKMFSMIPDKKVITYTRSILFSYILYTLIFNISAFIISFLLLFSKEKKKTYRKNMARQKLKYQTLFNNIKDSIFVIEFNSKELGKYIDVNDSACNKFGYTKEEFSHLSHREIDGTTHSLDNDILKDLTSYEKSRFERVFVSKSGEQVPVEINASLLSDYEKPAILFIARDITNRKLSERKIKDALLKAEQATEYKSKFLANMSHEIRTPMNAILGLNYLLQKTELNKKQKDYVLKVENASVTLLKIINDILDISRIESGKLKFENIKFNLNDILSKLSNIVTINIQKKELELYFDIHPDVPFNYMGDPLRLEQVLLNLVNNAVKFTEQGHIVVSCKVDNLSETDVHLKFQISDTGIGLTSEEISKLFKTFQQADSSTTRKYGGTGLGLSIAKELVEKMNGKIWVDSKKGVGSNFHFTVKLQRAEENKEKEMAYRELLNSRVMIIDSDEISCSILKRLITGMSFDVKTYGIVKEALNDDYLSKTKMLLIDYEHIIENEEERLNSIVEIINKKNPDIKIVFLLYPEDEAIKMVEHFSECSYVFKPITQSILFDTIVSMLNGNEIIDDRASKAIADYDNSLKGKKILLVEDNEINQEIGKEILQGFKLTVHTASNGKEAVEKASAAGAEYDLILMDLQMPVMDGMDATGEIRKIERLKDIPIIALTADAVEGVKEMVLQSGMNDFVTKPFSPDKLFNLLKKWIAFKEDSTGKNNKIKKKRSILICEEIAENVDKLSEILSEKYSLKISINEKITRKIIENSPPELLIINSELMDTMDKELLNEVKDKSIPIVVIYNNIKDYDENLIDKDKVAGHIIKPFKEPDILRLVDEIFSQGNGNEK